MATVVLTAVLGPAGLGLSVAAAGVAAAATGAALVTGLSGGNLGQILKAGAIAGVTAFAFAGLNSVDPVQAFSSPNFNPVGYAENVAGGALVGCASSAASGGSCGSGAAAGAVSAGFAPLTATLFPNASGDLGQRIGGTFVQATAGGLASVAGGGKFANGAVTGAFQYLVTIGPLTNQSGDRSSGSGDWKDAIDGPNPNYPPPPTKSGGWPNSQIPDGDWTWSDDPNNSRGGTYRNGSYSASWDDPDTHWDIDDGQGNRQRYNRFGAPISADEAHGGYSGPLRIPFSPRVGPFIFMINPCAISTMCMDPNKT